MAPNGVDPIPNAFAYVPLSTGQFTPGVGCDLCGMYCPDFAIYGQRNREPKAEAKHEG